MPSIVIPRCIVTKVYHSEKSGKDYLTIEDGENTFNFGSGVLDLSGTPTLTPVKIEGEIGAGLFGRNQSLHFKSFKATPLS